MKSRLSFIAGRVLADCDVSGYDPTKLFHKRVNKRFIPSYYEIIKEPMAFSVIKTAVSNRTYNTFEGFVRDCALIWHNAHTYNRPGVAAYEDASTVKTALELQFQKLVDEEIISEEQKAWPDLGEIPEADPIPSEPENEEEEEGDEKEDDDEDEDESEDTDEEGGRKKRKRGRRPSGVRRDTGGERTLKKRGRPPKVDTPMEARIKNVLKGIRKPKNAQGDLMIHNFEKLPDKGTLPEYYADVKEPIAIEIIKRKQKRKKYNSVEHFMKDIDLMFDNAMSYNMDDSVIYKDAAFLKKEAHRLADIEMKRPDKDFVMEDGRVPLPKGITYNGELWQVGDWVHLRNANDVTKPIIAQIYRTWQNQEGEHWINACWYYRPEQTIHHYERHFLPNEVVKTGQYRDHPIKDIVDRCFVMFITRYHKGRPRGIPMEREIYVCRARYNEEKHRMNEIKTWTSCLPDEVREKDYEMDLFGDQRKIREVPSPLLHMLKEDQKEDEMPSPQWGAPGAPPIVGGVYKGERDKDVSSL
jgi:chromatin structure-remodeling complex subunit RSC1/2